MLRHRYVGKKELSLLFVWAVFSSNALLRHPAICPLILSCFISSLYASYVANIIFIGLSLESSRTKKRIALAMANGYRCRTITACISFAVAYLYAFVSILQSPTKGFCVITKRFASVLTNNYPTGVCFNKICEIRPRGARWGNVTMPLSNCPSWWQARFWDEGRRDTDRKYVM